MVTFSVTTKEDYMEKLDLGKIVIDRYYSREGGERCSICGEWCEHSLRKEKEYGTFTGKDV